MSKRRISNKEVSRIGAERISRLLDLSIEALRAGRIDRARRYVGIARRIGMKTRVKMPKDRRFCKECLVPLVPGLSCSVRLNGGTMSVTCGLCGEIWRMPYDKERGNNDREGCKEGAHEKSQRSQPHGAHRQRRTR